MSVDIFPNPFSDQLQISTENSKGDYKVVIINALGEVVYQANNQNKLSVSHLPGGLYIVHFSDEQQHTCCRIMVKQ
ncbi:MAG: T9SS type A sorting domain-containing protein [Saprospiraceae bacterium]|uniref:T9SS type A sorting domain-containing protein n=1 Tax=Candidatus Opimibacter skivensis TaxID=2982028 RepID=A0A9D7SPT2_9BACT|nr:T9SS type A sorting domain-containing protein [Candidatus Opimibacter skivensis]